MNVSQKKAVSPIIATLLLIAITVAAGVIVYVFVTGLSGNLTKQGGNQLTEQVTVESYDFQSTNFLTVYLSNTGTSAVTLSSVYFNGAPAQFYGSCGTSVSATTGYATSSSGSTAVISVNSGSTSVAATTNGTWPTTVPAPQSAQSSCQLNLFDLGNVSAGTSYQVKIVTADGGITPYNVVAGSSS
ncbi:MAG: type IV pilin [Nitrososphaerota archaeon]|nr:type IV pilin [Nitrososphaerota archaeon]